MGFIISEDLKTIIKPVTTNFDKSKVIKIPFTTIHHSIYQNLHIWYNLKEYLLFVDIEPEHILGYIIENNKKNLYIPNIRELTIIIIKKINFLKNKLNINDDGEIYEFKNLNTHKEYISNFLDIYKTYEQPTIIAHNGMKFDFIIIQAYIVRYMNTLDTLYFKQFQFLDSWVIISNIRNKLPKDSHIKEKLKQLKNGTLFIEFSHNYQDQKNLINYKHTATGDCKLLMYWFSYICNLYR
uniref:Uncharacterized protein n=1 Tax=Faxonius propinquus nudivirus TaxID=3139431 RepID=A0AAU8GCF6_9VIRU